MDKTRITKTELITLVASRTGVTKAITKTVLEDLFDIMAENLRAKKGIHLGKDVGRIAFENGRPVFLRGRELRI